MNQKPELTRSRHLFRIAAHASTRRRLPLRLELPRQIAHLIGRSLVGPALLAVPLMLLGASSTLGQTATPAEEFLGPFPSWTQVQCSGADDTSMLQSALNSLGTPGPQRLSN